MPKGNQTRKKPLSKQWQQQQRKPQKLGSIKYTFYLVMMYKYIYTHIQRNTHTRLHSLLSGLVSIVIRNTFLCQQILDSNAIQRHLWRLYTIRIQHCCKRTLLKLLLCESLTYIIIRSTEGHCNEVKVIIGMNCHCRSDSGKHLDNDKLCTSDKVSQIHLWHHRNEVSVFELIEEKDGPVTNDYVGFKFSTQLLVIFSNIMEKSIMEK